MLIIRFLPESEHWDHALPTIMIVYCSTNTPFKVSDSLTAAYWFLSKNRRGPMLCPFFQCFKYVSCILSLDISPIQIDRAYSKTNSFFLSYS